MGKSIWQMPLNENSNSFQKCLNAHSLISFLRDRPIIGERRRARRKDNRGQPGRDVHHRAGASRGGALLVANGSASNGPAAWKRDLMEKNASGSVWRIEPANGARKQLAGNLAYPYGLLDEADSVVVSESWRSALTRISPGASGRNEPVLENLPAYPSRLRGAPTMRFGSPCSRREGSSSNSCCAKTAFVAA